MKSILDRLLPLAVSLALIGCTAPITVVPEPVNGDVSTVPIPTITLKFGSTFTSQPSDGLLIDGKLYPWAQFSPPPAANGKSSLAPIEWPEAWIGGSFVTGYGYQHSLGISYTCGFFCVQGIPAFVFYPPYLTLGADGNTTKNTSLDLTYEPQGSWQKLWVAIQNAAPAGGLWVGIYDETPTGAATQLCSNTAACEQPGSSIEVLIKEGDTTAPFYINAIKSGPMTYRLYAEAVGVEIDNAFGNIK